MGFVRLSSLALSLCSVACSAAPPPVPNPALSALLAERKFEPDECYTGADTAEDGPLLASAVDNAISDIAAMPLPIEGRAVRNRLERLIGEVDGFATEDRDEAYRYAIRIWRAAGQREESHLFARNDAAVVRTACQVGD